MATIVANTSFKIPADGDKLDIITIVGNPLTDDDDVAIWLAASVTLEERQTNVGTMRVLARFIKANWSSIPAIGTAMIFHVDQGGTEEDVEVNDTPLAGQIRVEVGDTIYVNQNSNHFLVGMEQLIQFYLEASTGN